MSCPQWEAGSKGVCVCGGGGGGGGGERERRGLLGRLQRSSLSWTVVGDYRNTAHVPSGREGRGLLGRLQRSSLSLKMESGMRWLCMQTKVT